MTPLQAKAVQGLEPPSKIRSLRRCLLHSGLCRDGPIRPPFRENPQREAPRPTDAARHIEVRGTTTNIVAKLHERLVGPLPPRLPGQLAGLIVSLLAHVGLAVVLALLAFSVQRDQVVDPIELGWATTAAKSTGENAPPVVVESVSAAGSDACRSSGDR